MKKMIITFCVLFVTNIFALNKITITTGEWQPWTSVTLKNNGVAIDIVKSIFESQGVKTEFRFYPWKRAYNLAKHGKYDASAIWFKTKDRERYFLYSKPIFATQDVIIYKKGKKVIFNKYSDLTKYKIALTRGYSYGKVIDNMVRNKQIKVKWVNSDLLALKQIERRNNFDIFICAKSVAKSLIVDNFKNPNIFEFYPKATITNPLYLIVSKKIKDGKEIIDKFNKGLEKFKKDGLLDKMLNDSYSGKYK